MADENTSSSKVTTYMYTSVREEKDKQVERITERTNVESTTAKRQ